MNLILYLLIFLQIIIAAYSNYKDLNVGTVLFTKYDVSRKCWSNEQLALLRSRMIYQDVLPKLNVVQMNDENFANALLSYFNMAIGKVKKSTTGRTRQLNLLALCDVIGGYLRHFILPQARDAFYCGHLKYETAGKLNDLYEEMKAFLGTDGLNWLPPSKHHLIGKRSVLPLPDVTNVDKNSDPCAELTFEDKGRIPMPYLDSANNPTSILIPFRDHPLRNIRSKDSAYILLKFYVLACKCINLKNLNRDAFNREFSSFIDNEVIKHTDDENLYPAFGGVFRIKDTIKNGGEDVKFPVNATTGMKAAVFEDKKIFTKPYTKTNGEPKSDKNSKMIILIMAAVIALWIIITILYCICKRRRKKISRSKKEKYSASNLENQKGGEFYHPSKGYQDRSKVKYGPVAQPVILEDSCCRQNISNTVSQHKLKLKMMDITSKRNKSPRKPSVKFNENDKFYQPSQPFEPVDVCVGSYTVPSKFRNSRERNTLFSPKPAIKSWDETCCTKNVICSKCKRTNCSHEFAQKKPANFVTNVASIFSRSQLRKVKSVKSAPVSLPKSQRTNSACHQSTGTSSTTTCIRPTVFGYNFETSSSGTSTLGSTPYCCSPRNSRYGK